MKTIIILAMHGMPPKDFPPDEKREFIRLHSQVTESKDKNLKMRHDALDAKMRQWPRTQENDTFYFASQDLAKAMESKTGLKTMCGFNEFCAPSMTEIMDQAAALNPEKIVITTPMLIRGGNHAEEEIPEDIESAKKRYPHIRFEYAWPFATEWIAEFLSRQVIAEDTRLKS